MIEVLVAMLVLGLGLMPLYATFVWGRRGVTSSRFATVANQLARETIEELRQTPPAAVDDLVASYAEARPVTGSLFRTAVAHRPRVWQSDDPRTVLDRTPAYAPGYSRMALRMESTPITTGRLRGRGRRVLIEITWEERGGENETSRPGLTQYRTLLVDHRAEAWEFPE